MIFDLYEQGLGAMKIAKELQYRERLTAMGKTKWCATNISKILKNVTYKRDTSVIISRTAIITLNRSVFRTTMMMKRMCALRAIFADYLRGTVGQMSAIMKGKKNIPLFEMAMLRMNVAGHQAVCGLRNSVVPAVQHSEKTVIIRIRTVMSLITLFVTIK